MGLSRDVELAAALDVGVQALQGGEHLQARLLAGKAEGGQVVPVNGEFDVLGGGGCTDDVGDGVVVVFGVDAVAAGGHEEGVLEGGIREGGGIGGRITFSLFEKVL